MTAKETKDGYQKTHSHAYRCSSRTHQRSILWLRGQIVISSWCGVRALPYAFTEQGVAMLSSVLHSPRAIQVNIEIMRAFVRLRQLLTSNAELARKLAALESNYDAQFKMVFDAIRELMKPPEPGKKRPIGFAPWKRNKRGQYHCCPTNAAPTLV
jgi:hypothetical protein